MSIRPPLPFGLGRSAACSPNRCIAPDVPLPSPGTPLHDQVASALSQLFQTFFQTSLRYLGVSEILDWLELNGTVDAWILTGLEQGRLPDEVGNEKNLEFGREAIKSVIKGALEAEDGAWATSLRETGFSSALSMAYEGIVAQLKPNKATPVPCLHALLTPTGLAILKSAPLRSAFPLCPPRAPPSPSPLLASIRALIQRGALSGPAWKVSSVWRQHMRRAFAAYHSMLREIAEEIVSGDPTFSQEYRIFLENISQPIQLLQLIADDFEAEFGPDATRGLLAVGETGGDNILSIMDFCAAKKPSELLARVKQRVAEKHEREKRTKEIASLRSRIKELDSTIRGLLLDYRSGEIGPERTLELQKELEETLDQRDAVKKEVEHLQAVEDVELKERKREKVEKEKILATMGIRFDGNVPIYPDQVPPAAASTTSNPPPQLAITGIEEDKENVEFMLGSSKDLLMAEVPQDPFAATAPRAISPVPSSRKGKAKALVQPGKVRGSARYAPPPPAHRYNTPRAPLRNYHDQPSNVNSIESTPVSSRAPSPAPSSTTHTTTASSPTFSDPSAGRRISSRSRLPPPPPPPPRSRLAASSPSSSPARRRRRRLAKSDQVEEDDHCERCCPACRAEAQAVHDGGIVEEEEKGDGGSLMTNEVREDEQGIEPEMVTTTSAPMSRDPSSDATVAETVDDQERDRDAPSGILNGREEGESGEMGEKAEIGDRVGEKEGEGQGGTSRNKKKKKKKKSAAKKQPPSTTPTTTTNISNKSTSFAYKAPSLPRYPPPKCCPPGRCTGVGPDYSAWTDLDGLLYETCLAGFKYELIGALPAPLFHLREKLAKTYLLSGGRMCLPTGEPKSMDEFMRMAEARGLWSTANHPEVQAWGQRVLAISLQKLVDVLRATLGEICICKMSNHLDILVEARNRLEQCEKLDRTIPIDLPEMDQQSFMKWVHSQLRAGKLSGPEWEGIDRQYKLADFLLAFSDAFDAATDRLVLHDGNPYVIAEEMITLLECQGGVRAFDTAMRFGPHPISHEFGSGVDLLDGTENTPIDTRPLQAWGRLLELSKEARIKGLPISRELAEQEKQRGNDYFAAGQYEKAIVSFSTSHIIFGTEPTFPLNAAAARMKLNTPAQFSEAVADCTLALFYQPSNIKALYRRGTALAMLGEWKQAFADLKHLEKVAPDNETAKEALKRVTERHEALVLKARRK